MIDITTVVFAEEIPLIEIQARSIDLYTPPELIDSVFVVVNDDRDVCSKIDKSWWGQHHHKVKIFHFSDFSYFPANMNGWDSQQLLKLLVAAKSQNTYTYVLDAKTWFVKTLLPEFLFDSNSKAHAELMPLFDGFKSAQPFLTEFYGRHYRHIIGPGGVPFTFHNQSVRSMIDEIQTNTNRQFDDFFCESVQFPINITEFTLYSAYILSKNSFNEIYTYRQPYKVVNIAHFQIDEFSKLFQEMQLPLTLTASIHKNLYPNLSQTQYNNWCDFLADKKLFSDPENAKNQLNIYRKGVDNGTGIRL
jgi:hypothetical protein